jgi:hypothetical protein
MGLSAKCHHINVGHSNGRACHATTLKHPRCSDPGSRSDPGGERADFQSSLEFALPHAQSEPCPRTRAIADAFAEFSLEFALPPARSERCPTRPNTLAIGDAFAAAGHRRTELAAGRDGATRRAAPHRRPSDGTRAPFCFPIPDRSLALALGVRRASLHQSTRRRRQDGRAVGGRAAPRMLPVMPPTFAVSVQID